MGHFCPPGSGSGSAIWNADPDPDPATQINADPVLLLLLLDHAGERITLEEFGVLFNQLDVATKQTVLRHLDTFFILHLLARKN